MCVRFSNTWPRLTWFGVSVARSSEVHIRTLLDYSLFLLEHWATYLSHMCVRDREPKWNTHWDTEVLRLQLHSWKQTHRLTKEGGGGGDCHGWNGIPGIIWWTSLLYTLISFIVKNSLEALLLCLFFMSCCSDHHFLREGSSKPLKTKRAPCWSQPRPTCQRKAMKLSRSHSA